MREEDKSYAEKPNAIRTMSFKAVIVMTKHDSAEPSMNDVLTALRKSGLTYAQPATLEAPIVISLHDR